ncbi:hypothetical protein LWI29_011178 [Acer saccharum]|uniref:Uncharacterized protein n=1 Tax=Acer saccharum TaxID=4024 RepID=A0AA39T9I0_ACESA|nr:hypothetical protein LWI29_011178 [Acer saccharum]
MQPTMKKSSSLLAELQGCRPMSFTVLSLDVTEESVDHINVSRKLASFLEKCHFYKKMISTQDDVFMYRV